MQGSEHVGKISRRDNNNLEEHDREQNVDMIMTDTPKPRSRAQCLTHVNHAARIASAEGKLMTETRICESYERKMTARNRSYSYILGRREGKDPCPLPNVPVPVRLSSR